MTSKRNFGAAGTVFDAIVESLLQEPRCNPLSHALTMHLPNTLLTLVVLLVATGDRTAPAGDMSFPGKSWKQTSPQSQGVDSAKLEEAVAWLEQHLPPDGVKRLVIARNGQVIWKGDEADRRQCVWSVAKAFTSTAHGLLIDDGKFTLDTLAKDYNPKLERHYARSGYNNNHVFVFPAWNMVITRLGLDAGKKSGGFPIPSVTYNEFFKRVGVALRDPVKDCTINGRNAASAFVDVGQTGRHDIELVLQ